MDHWFRSLLRHRRTVRKMRRSHPDFLEAVRGASTESLVGYVRLFERVEETGDFDALASLMSWRAQAGRIQALREQQSAALTESARELARMRGLRRRSTEHPRDGLPCPDCGNIQETVSTLHVHGGVHQRVSGFVDNWDFCKVMFAVWNIGKRRG